MSYTLKDAKDVNTASLVITGLVGGWLTARETGIRPLGGVLWTVGGPVMVGKGRGAARCGFGRHLCGRVWTIAPVGEEDWGMAVGDCRNDGGFGCGLCVERPQILNEVNINRCPPWGLTRIGAHIHQYPHGGHRASLAR